MSSLHHLDDNTSKENSTGVPSTPHDYDSISDANIKLNQFESDPGTVIENTEELDTNEEGDVQELELSTDSTPVNDAATDSSHETHSQLVTLGSYSSLRVKQRITHHQPALYIQLGAQAATVVDSDTNLV